MHTSLTSMSGSSKTPPSQVTIAYVLFLGTALAMFNLVAKNEFSAILTIAVMLQCLAFGLLGLQTLCTGSVSGISARALMLDAVALCCRLASTMWLHGYLPVDASGDWFYQAVDICSLMLVLWLLHRILVVERSTYQAQEDSFPIMGMIIGALLLASLLHADMNARPIFDTLWMTGLFVSAVAVLPQLWLIAKTGGRVEALTSHYIAAMAFSRALSGTFMWHARADITCDPWIHNVNHAILAILSAHALHMLLLGDFAYYYVRAVAKSGLSAALELGDEIDV